MNVELKLKSWNMEESVIKGEYSVILSGNEISKQSFNDGYASKKIPFSSDTLAKAKDLEESIIKELSNIIK